MAKTVTQNPDGTTTVTVDIPGGGKSVTTLDANGEITSAQMFDATGALMPGSDITTPGAKTSPEAGYREQVYQDTAKKQGWATADIVRRKVASAIDTSNLSPADAEAAVRAFQESGQLDLFIEEAKGEVLDAERQEFHTYWQRVYVQPVITSAMVKGPTAQAEAEVLAGQISRQEDLYYGQMNEDYQKLRRVNPNYSFRDALSKVLVGSIQKVVGENGRGISSTPGAFIDAEALVQANAQVAVAELQQKKLADNQLRLAINRANAQINKVFLDPNVSPEVRSAYDQVRNDVLGNPDLSALFLQTAGTMTADQFVQSQLDPALQGQLAGTEAEGLYKAGDLVGTTAGIRKAPVEKAKQEKAEADARSFDAWLQAKLSDPKLDPKVKAALGTVDTQGILAQAGGSVTTAQNIVNAQVNEAQANADRGNTFEAAFGANAQGVSDTGQPMGVGFVRSGVDPALLEALGQGQPIWGQGAFGSVIKGHSLWREAFGSDEQAGNAFINQFWGANPENAKNPRAALEAAQRELERLAVEQGHPGFVTVDASEVGGEPGKTVRVGRNELPGRTTRAEALGIGPDGKRTPDIGPVGQGPRATLAFMAKDTQEGSPQRRALDDFVKKEQYEAEQRKRLANPLPRQRKR